MAKIETTKVNPPELAEVHRVFSFKAPGALSVSLVSDFTHWQEKPISLRKHYDGIWRASVSLPPGTYHYRFVVDGEWRDDPPCTLRLPNPLQARASQTRGALGERAAMIRIPIA